MKLRTTLVAVLAAVLVTGACSGSSGPAPASSGAPTGTRGTAGPTGTTAAAGADPARWAGAYCGGLTTAVEGLAEVLTTMLGGADDPAALKPKMVEFADRTGKAFGDAARRLQELGAPSAGARALHDEAVGFFTDLSKTWSTTGAELSGLDPQDPRFADRMGELGGDDVTVVGEQVKKLKENPELAEAFRNSPECSALTERLQTIGG
ncbi:hypothetical protein [Saccharothrix obliqua]|uniref:hypothetical protein n=1 Tax=Saccharothrix obliqua TaxID=2861747 RepID=UPI001C5F3CF7|nr:hypothetical protein [Saccharothrix obliqua]MBW4719814.1 hypothetical protein [Saccharothrix obliqua]